MNNYTIQEINIYKNKGDEPITPIEANLIKDKGLYGDFNADGGEKQLALLGNPLKEKIDEGYDGLCFKKMKANIIFNESIKELRVGMQLSLGEAIIEITKDKKKCFPEICSSIEKGNKCLMASELRFAKVIKSGKILK